MLRFATIEDRELVESICNLPEIRSVTSFEGAPPFDALPYLTAPSFTVVGDEGCFLALHLDETRYAIHTNLLPAFRGASAVNAAHEALALAFLGTDATELLTMVPSTNKQARVLARQMGFRLLFSRPDFWPRDGVRHPLDFFALSLDDWIRSGVCAPAGEFFHRWLHSQPGLPAHRADGVHDAYAGAALTMAVAGRARKAVEIYNRWARLAFYETISVLTEEPLRVDIKHCVLRFEGDQLNVEARHA